MVAVTEALTVGLDEKHTTEGVVAEAVIVGDDSTFNSVPVPDHVAPKNTAMEFEDPFIVTFCWNGVTDEKVPF